MRLVGARFAYSLSALCLIGMLSKCAPGAPGLTAAPPTPTAAAVTVAPASTATTAPEQPTQGAPLAATVTPTATPAGGGIAETPTSVGSRCANLTGELEIQMLVGPAEAVDLEPVAVGNLPFAVTEADGVYMVAGQAPIDYEAALTADWGDYEVTMNLDLAVDGVCAGQAGAEQLDLNLQMSGEQLVLVHVGGQEWPYPWSGTQSRDLTLPLTEGASAEGEGWTVVLHLGN